MARYDVPKAAPAPLRLVQVFVNTVDLAHGLDWLDGPWLREHGLAGASADVARAKALRESLRSLLETPLEEERLALLNRLAAALPLRTCFDRAGRAELEPARAGHPLGRLFGIVVSAQRDGSWDRLKACRQCRWAFYDYSRNRSAQWCSMSICGNRAKTRAYRRRRGTGG